ncbi:MAG: MBOAT family protein [Candidatus Omnitrophica bacterium]|nr:MBOAT family protein [Candidatus Omnitrophota bacterium]
MVKSMLLTICLAIIIVIAYWLLLPRKWRSLFLLLCSFVFIAIFNLIYAIYYMAMISAVYIAALLIKERPKNKHLILSASLILLIGNLCFYKYFRVVIEFITVYISEIIHLPAITIPQIVFPLGLSLITFRLVHYIIEAYREKAPKASLVDFSLYVIFFPTFLAGPLERFPRFQEQTKAIGFINISEINYGLMRILLGIIKKFIIANSLYRVITPIIFSPQDYSRAMLIVFIYLSAIWLYMELSGYTDIAIGIARLFGYKIVENFNRPYLKKNIALFWRSWHISVYSWIRDYFYFPLFVYRGSRIKLYVGIFCTMLVFMLWHRGSWGFFFAGLYHGAGLIIWNIFQESKKRFPLLRQLVNHKYLDSLSIFITFNFVAFSIGIPFFGRDLTHIKAITVKLIGG